MDAIELAYALDRKICPHCDGEATSRVVEEVFPYGIDEDAVELSAMVEVWSCETCHESWTYDETSHHDAVCRHLGVLTPTEIRALRKTLGCSREDFAEMTGFGEASIQRWESGHTIQTRGNDLLLRLLEHAQVREFLPIIRKERIQLGLGYGTRFK